jgi:prepilin-type N-terminal cleavage/methylation domain-containing protein
LRLFEFSHHRRRGVTLTELLVVVSIVVLLAGALVPVMQPVLRGQKVREASRQVSVFMTGAQARAVELGRPVGVWIERAAHDGDLPNLWYTSHRLYLAEQPPPYTGDVFDARVVLNIDMSRGVGFAQYINPATQAHCCSTLFASVQRGLPLVNPGDLIQFNGRGPLFPVSRYPDSNGIEFLFNANDPAQAQTLMQFIRTGPATQDIAVFDPGVRFQIIRRPTKTSASPLELPRNSAVDLSVSGYGSPFTFGSPFAPPADGSGARFRQIQPQYDVVIMFSPSGGIDRVHYISHDPTFPSFWEIPQGSIHVMLARDDQVGRDILGNPNIARINGDIVTDHNLFVAGSLGSANLRDEDNIWLTISGQNGRVLTNPNGNAFVNGMSGAQLSPLPLTTDARPFIVNARRYTSLGSSMGGR